MGVSAVKVKPQDLPMLIERCRELVEKGLYRCVECGSTLHTVEMWIDVPYGEEGELWLFATCHECKYQNALWKVFQKAETKALVR